MIEKTFYDLTNPQKSIYLTEQYYSNSSINTICATTRILEKTNFSILEQALNFVIKNNDIFRTKFIKTENSLKQYIEDYSFLPIDIIELNSDDDLKSLEKSLAQNPFNIEEKTFEFKMFKLPDSTGGVIINIHHIIADSWTIGLSCVKTLTAYYNILNNIEMLDEDYKFSYIDFINSEKEYFASERCLDDKMYWKNIFSTIPSSVSIPGSFSNTDNFNCTANREDFIIPQKLVSTIQSYCRENKASIFNFFMAILAIYMYKINNTNEFVIGTPILNRTNFKEKNTCGMYINVAPLKINIDSNNNFLDFLNIVSHNSKELLRHQKYSYTNIIDDLRDRDSSIPSLYNIILSYQITKTNAISEINYKTNWTFNGNSNEDIEIHLHDSNDTGNLTLSFDYKINKYTKQDIININNRLLYIIEQILNNNLIIKNINIATPDEQSLVLNDFNNTNMEYNENMTIIDFFEKQVELTPNNPAITFHNSTLTFKQLNEKSNSLAHIINQKISKKNTIIPIISYRSSEVIIGILAILKSGHAYLPIDPDYPQERIDYILNDCNSDIILTQKILNNNFKDKTIIEIDLNNNIYNDNKNNLNIKPNPTDLSYLIYTSGSTGTPKGVKLTHKNYTNFYNAMLEKIKYLKDGSNHSIISITTISFDIFGFETLISLISGIHLFLTDNFEQKDTASLEKIIYENNIDIIQTTPSVINFHIENLNNQTNFANIKYFILAGEQLPKKLVKNIKKISPHAIILNGYGPSETTIFSTISNVTNLEKITIGKPIANTQIYILNDDLNILPTNTLGEIYISGDGVGNGYLNKNSLTHKSFIKNPFKDNILYKTGDIGLWTDDGNILCKGRIDNQIKLHGLRIELEEIEYKINMFKTDISISSIVVLRKINNKDILHAFITSTELIDTEELKRYLLKSLPSYMVPTSYSFLEKFPKTPNGKIDKKALPKEITNNDIYNPPITLEQKNICKILESLLKIKIKNIDENIFVLGADSLIVIQLMNEIKNVFNKNLTIKNIFENNTIRLLANLINNTNPTNLSNTLIKPTEKRDFYPLSSSQKNIYYSSNITNNTAYNMTSGIEFFKEVNIQKIENCFNKLIERHESFRTQFEFENGEIVQKILDSAKIKLEYINDNGDINTIINKFNTKFDLSKAPLIKVGIKRLNDKHYLLLISIHHIISDGISFQILIDEFCKLYNDQTLKNLDLTYKDFAIYETEALSNNSYEEGKKYWTQKFNKNIPVLNLPTTYNRPSTFTYTGNKINKTINKILTENIQQLCIQNNVTPFMFMLAVYYITLYKYSDTTDILVGTPVANRNLPNISNIIGMFVNTIVLKATIDNNLSFMEFCNQIKNTSLEAFKYQNYPFNELVKNLNIKRDLSRNILFDTMFTYQNNGIPEIKIFDDIKYFLPDTNISKFDLSLEVIPQNSAFELNFEYCADLFSKHFINDFAEHYIEIIKNIIKNPNEKIKHLDILSENEKNKIIYDFNNTKLNYPSNTTIPQLFEKQVLETPNKIAAIFEDTSLTYIELNNKINNLSHYLIKNNIKPGDIVGILLNRSIEMLIAMMAILKVGATYVPIDPTYPEERINYILENSNTKLILSEPKLQNKFILQCPIINIKLENTEIYNLNNITNPNVSFDSSNLAYIIYTSGSTGNPKGVMLTHKNVINFIYGVMDRIDFNKDLNMVSLTTICFDIFVLESLLPMCTGITTVIANSEEQTIPQALNNLCLKNNIKILQTTPSKLMLLISNNNSLEYVKNLEYILIGGEAVPTNLVKKLKKLTKSKIFNMYGPTETTVWSTIKELTHSTTVTIGTPLANTYTYILDDHNNILPIGVNGNLFIGGDGVSNGYLNKPELTKEKFIDNPFVPGTKMYNTGDIAKLMPNGEIIYSGRSDFQVKIHGLRIELGEIEKQISNFDGISNTAVCVKKDSSDRDILCAYFMGDKLISINKLKGYLKKKIPAYMIPIYFKQMENFEYTPNGKIDRKKLPLPEFTNTVKEIVSPETETEKILTKIIESILAITPISITDNIFDIGADSLTALRLQIELLNENINIPYADIFKFNTIKDLALRIDSNTSTEVTIQDKNYNYDKINEIISKNNINNLTNLKYTPIQNVILTGATGFLGIHILQELLENYNINIYCLLREPLSGISIEEKFRNRLNFYFGNKYDKEIGKRIILIKSDITFNDLGLSNFNYELLKNNCNYIINSAANVKHYGYYSEFEKINVNGVKNLIKFALKENMKFIQISTTSISGNTLVGKKSKLNNFNSLINYTEDKLFVGQSFENVYTYSKFESEKIVLENIINNNLDGLILRVGYITPRYSDGIFQINKQENALFNKIQTFINLNCVPESLKYFPVEFTPVDYLAKSIIKAIEYYNKSFNILHLYNPNHIIIEDLIKIISEKSSLIPDEDFRILIQKTLKDPNKRYIISSIVNDMDSEFNLIYTSDIKLNNNLSVEFLKQIGFSWPIIDQKYIKLILYLFEL